MLRKFLAETVTNGSIGLNRPKGYIPLGQRQKKPLLTVLILDACTVVVCLLCLCFSGQRALLITFQPIYLQT